MDKAPLPIIASNTLMRQLSSILPISQTAFHQELDMETQNPKSGFHHNSSKSQTSLPENIPSFAKPTTANNVYKSKNLVRVMSGYSHHSGSANLQYQSGALNLNSRCLPCRRQSLAEAQHRYSISGAIIQESQTARPNQVVENQLNSVID